MIVLVTGGSGSGKSAFAEDRVLSFGEARRIYIATMYPFDMESKKRISRHRNMRAGKGFETVERYTNLKANYLDELKRLTETLQKVSDQSVRLTRDSEEMENLNRTLTGICKIYEMQLKGASQQIGTIDQINEQSKRMAEQIEQLNGIYARMIEAMTVNMNLKVKE